MKSSEIPGERISAASGAVIAWAPARGAGRREVSRGLLRTLLVELLSGALAEAPPGALAEALLEPMSGVPESLQGAQRDARSDAQDERISGGFSLVQQCPECGSEVHGPVRVKLAEGRGLGVAADVVTPVTAPLVSVSYAGEIAVVAVAPPGTQAFGIDAEPDTEAVRAAVAQALGLDVTRAQVSDWTRIEAVAKASGRGLRGDWHGGLRGAPTLAAGEPSPWLSDLELPTSPPVILSLYVRAPDLIESASFV